MRRFSVSRPTVDKVLKVVQGFEPEGVGARDLKECLKIQLADYNFENEALEEIIGAAIDKHLDDIGNNDFVKVSKRLDPRKRGGGDRRLHQG